MDSGSDGQNSDNSVTSSRDSRNQLVEEASPSMRSKYPEAPEASALCNLCEVQNWVAKEEEECLHASVILQPSTRVGTNVNKTLLCHDMMSGYLDDRFVQGVDQAEAYRFFHWSCIDIFVYFSHKFVTIPPAGWIDAAHLHGVKVLGTLITEWDDGAKCCNLFLQSKDEIFALVQKLVAIADHFKFEGWLVNIENKIETAQIQNLVLFLQSLTEEMHKNIPQSVVIWYDSVIESGQLKWQDELNSLNKCFFDVCDGIFLNYNWKEEHLSRTAEMAGTRLCDVYAGIDVFGRSTIGGGGFNTIEPLKLARTNGLSTAIFAPGWVYEVLGKDAFTENEYKFWSLMSDSLTTQGPSSLPFSSSFCQGFGLKTYHAGKVIGSHPWHNLSLQQFQPTSVHSQASSANRMEIYLTDAYDGGSCFRIKGQLTDEEDRKTFELLKCTFCINEDTILSIVCKNKSGVNHMRMIVYLQRMSGDEIIRTCLINGEKIGNGISYLDSSDRLNCDLETETNVTWKEESDWLRRSFLLQSTNEQTIKSLKLEVFDDVAKCPTDFDVLIGQIQIIPLSFLDLPHEKLSIQCLHLEKFVFKGVPTLSCTLQWNANCKCNSANCQYLIYHQCTSENKEVAPVFLSKTRKCIFKVSQLDVTENAIRFIIQVDIPGLSLSPLEKCAFIDVL